MVFRFLVLILLVPFVARAAEPQACRIERLDHARAACLGYHADLVLLAMDEAVAGTTSTLQAAYADEILTFEAGLRRSQEDWLRKMETGCRRAAPDDPVGYQTCRLQAAKRRRARLDATLADLQERLGATPSPGFDVPEEVEILIPLGIPGGNGPDSEARVPLTIPITPQ